MDGVPVLEPFELLRHGLESRLEKVNAGAWETKSTMGAKEQTGEGIYG